MKYTLIYWQDGNWLVGRLKERPDVFSQGKTLDELEENIRDVLKLMEETDMLDVPPDFQVKDLRIEAH